MPDKNNNSQSQRQENHTFVQPGVNQKYTFVTAIEEDISFLHVTAMFDYVVRFKRISRFFLNTSKLLGLIQFDLESIDQPHSVERAFNVAKIPQREA